MGVKRWQEDRLARLIDLREREHLTHREIADRLGVPKGQVDQQVSQLIYESRLKPRLGMLRPESGSASVARSWEEVRHQLKPLYEAGLDHEEMAARLQITRSQLHTQLNRMFRERRLAPRPRHAQPPKARGVKDRTRAS